MFIQDPNTERGCGV